MGKLPSNSTFLCAIYFEHLMKLLPLSFLVLWCLADELRAAENVIISEFMAANSTTLRDEDGDYEDWVELYNAGDTAANLGGWFLTDTTNTLAKWPFPATNLAPNQFLIVFASAKDRRVAGTNLHTNFKLSAGGEYLALVRPDGTNIATQFAPVFPPQVDDISYGLPVSALTVPVLTPGAAGKFLVPLDDALGTSWIFPAFNAAAWSNVTTGVGFDVSGASVLTPVADSVADWSTSGIQGFRNWRYGYYNKSVDVTPGYQPSEFTQFPRAGGAYSPTDYWNGSAWDWFNGNPPWDEMGVTWLHPNGVNNGSEHWVIRRWTATTNGNLSVTWRTYKSNPAGTGVTGKLFHNGVEKDTATIAGNDTVGVTRTVALPGVAVGDQIDLALTPIGPGGATDDGADGSGNSMVISRVGALTDFVGSNVAAVMRGTNSSAYLRVPFVVTNTADLDGLRLRLRYDDGFVAWLNGVEVARRNVPVAATGGAYANQTTDFGGAQGLNNWYYGFYNKTADADSVYNAFTDFSNTDPQWAWSGSAWLLGPGDPPWNTIGAGSWHPNGDNNGAVMWVIRRWASETAGTIKAALTFAKDNAACGNGVTLRVFHNGAPRLTRTIAFTDTAGFSTNLVINDVKSGDFIDFALDSLGTDSGWQDACDGSVFTVSITQDPSAGLAWNSPATTSRNAAEVPVPDEFDLTAFRNFLVSGTNMLAIHGLNAATNDDDFLMLPELFTTYFTVNPAQHVYFPLPTPGAPNSAGVLTLGPLVKDVKHTPSIPKDADNLVVTARVTPTLYPVASVTLRYRVMFGTEVSVPMLDNGASGDGLAGDGIYGASIPASTSTPSQMIRYYVTATDTNSNVLRSPPGIDLGAEIYFGTVVSDPSLTNSKLPVLHWFIENPGFADTDAGGRGSLFFNGEFHDNMLANLHGQSTRGFPKKSYDFSLAHGHKMKWASGQPRISDINLLTTWADKSHQRTPLAYEHYAAAQVPGHFAFPVRVQQNAQFHSVANFVENGDEEWLERLGLDQNGALYKMYNTAGDTSGVEKKTRKTEGVADLAALINGMAQGNVAARQAFMFDNLDVPEVVNFLTARALTGDTDCCHKNYYLYHDNDRTGEWQGMPWDVDLSFGRVFTCNAVCLGYYDETIYTNTGMGVGYGNTVFQPIIDTPATRQMYFRRVRSLMDQLVQPPGTPATNDLLRLRTQVLRDQIGPDAARDLAKWGTWGATETITQAVSRIWNEFEPGRRTFLYAYPEVPAAQPSNAVISIAGIEFRSANSNQAHEYLCLTNPNNYAVDLTGWRLDGGVRFTFKGGTVIPANSVAYVSPDKRAFRQRPVAPKGGQQLLVLGNYDGNLSAWGEGLSIFDTGGRLVTTNYFAGNPSPAQRYLRITEIMYSPAPLAGNTNDAQEFEYIELKNIGPSVLDLRGVRLTNGLQFTFGATGLNALVPGQRALLVRNTNAFTARYGAGLPIAGQFAGALDSSGEELRLEDSFGEKILEFSYDNAWYPITDGHGFSLVIVDENAHWSTWDDKASWRASGSVDGAPGTSDPPPPALPPIRINEALTHTDPPQVDAIELFNPTGTNVDVGGWFLSDDFGTPKKFRIPSPTILAPGGCALFTETNFNPVPGVPPSFSLGSDGDEVWLFSGDAATNFTGWLHGWSFGPAQNGVSFGRYVNSQGDEHFVAQSTNSLGTTNRYPLVGPVIISEVMFHPPDLGTNDNTQDEFIELHNITAAPVKLFDATNTMNTWRLRDAVDFDFPTNVSLPAGGRLLVVGFATNDATALAAFRANYGLDASFTILGPWSGKLDNSADTLELKRPDSPNGTNVPYILVERLAYRDTAPWPVTPDGEGASLQRRSISGYGNDVTNWFASAPTPGVTNGFNAPPTVTLTNPPNGAVFQSPVHVTLGASASDTDGSILRVEFFADGGKVGEATASPFALVWSNAPPGPHSLYAKARDNALGSANSATNTVFVISQPPAVAITSPTNLSLLQTGSNVTIIVAASDPDGSISLVELFAGTNKLSETTAQPFTYDWPAVPAGVYGLSAIATDDGGRRATSAVVTLALSSAASTNVSLIPTGALWKYLDDGSDQNTGWTNLAFPDTTWASGRSQLGFGDNDEATVIRRTNTVTGATNITFYFRLKFQVTNAPQFSSVLARLVRDDGAIGYLNGVEVFRSSMPTGAVTFQSFANVTASTAFEETNFFQSPFAPAPLVERTNIMAVEVHQVGLTSSDVSFNLELIGTRTLFAPVVVTPPASQLVQQGSNATLSVLALGTPPLGLQWRFNGTPLLNATNPTLTQVNVQSAQAGAYDVVITSGGGSLTSVVAMLTVNRPPTAGTDGLAVLMNEPSSRSVASLLTNDVDPDGDTLTLLTVSATSTSGGAVSVSSNLMSYAPLPNFTGPDLFTYLASDGRGATATGRVEILVVTAPLPSVNQIVFVPAGGNRRVRFLGNGGQAYSVQRSTNLTVWTSLYSTNAPPHGIVEYLDAVPPAGQAFYRAVSP